MPRDCPGIFLICPFRFSRPINNTYEEKPRITRYATTLNPKARPGLQRQSARRQPVVQAQTAVVQGLLCGNSSEKVPYYREKGPGVQGKRWPKFRYSLSCLKVRGVSPPSNRKGPRHNPKQVGNPPVWKPPVYILSKTRNGYETSKSSKGASGL